MAVAGIGNNSGTYTNYKSHVEKSSSANFTAAVNQANSKGKSVVDEFIKKHPKEAGTVNGQVNAGKAVLKKNGAENIPREDMTMEEYKQFFMEQQEMKAQQRRAMYQRRNQQAQALQMQMQMMGNTGFHQFFPGNASGSFPASLMGTILAGGGSRKISV